MKPSPEEVTRAEILREERWEEEYHLRRQREQMRTAEPEEEIL